MGATTRFFVDEMGRPVSGSTSGSGVAGSFAGGSAGGSAGGAASSAGGGAVCSARYEGCDLVIDLALA